MPNPLKNVKVSWGYYSQYMEYAPNHQPGNVTFSYILSYVSAYLYIYLLTYIPICPSSNLGLQKKKLIYRLDDQAATPSPSVNIYRLVNVYRKLWNKSPFYSWEHHGKSTISMAIFNSKLLVYQRINWVLPMSYSWTNTSEYLEIP
jgi:hypothetical protein